MNRQLEIERARQEATNAKLEGRSPEAAQNRLKELYRIPKKSKRVKVAIA